MHRTWYGRQLRNVLGERGPRQRLRQPMTVRAMVLPLACTAVL